MAVESVGAQIETVEPARETGTWTSVCRAEGHLALNYSPAGAFSPDGSALAIVNGDKLLLMDLRSGGVKKVLRPHIERIMDLEIQSANFLAPDRVLILASGLVETKKGIPPRTPELLFQWDIERDALFGKLNAPAEGSGFGPARYFADIRYVGLHKENNFDLWNPLSGKTGRITVPALTHPARLYSFSPDGQWLLLAQIETSSTADPIVVRLSEHQFVDALQGHQGTVLSMAFSRDSQRVVTACEDGKLRIWSVSGWKLLRTLSGHAGAVHSAEFSPDGQWLVSAGEDKTARIWATENGKLLQTLEESKAPLVSAAFSPDGLTVAASAEQSVQVWEKK